MALTQINQAQLYLKIAWDVGKLVTGSNPVRHQNLDNPVTRTINFGLLTPPTTADKIDEVYSAILTLAASTTTDYDLSAALTNVVNDVNITVGSIKLICVELLSASDTDSAGTVLGNACSSITVFGDVQSPLVLADASDKVTLGNGDVFLLTRRSAAGIDVAGGGTTDVLQIQNNDASVAAKIRLTLFLGSSN